MNSQSFIDRTKKAENAVSNIPGDAGTGYFGLVC